MEWDAIQPIYWQEMETKMRNETHLDHIATIIQIGHISKHTSEQIAVDVMTYMENFIDWEATD